MNANIFFQSLLVDMGIIAKIEPGFPTVLMARMYARELRAPLLEITKLAADALCAADRKPVGSWIIYAVDTVFEALDANAGDLEDFGRQQQHAVLVGQFLAQAARDRTLMSVGDVPATAGLRDVLVAGGETLMGYAALIALYYLAEVPEVADGWVVLLRDLCVAEPKFRDSLLICARVAALGGSHPIR